MQISVLLCTLSSVAAVAPVAPSFLRTEGTNLQASALLQDGGVIPEFLPLAGSVKCIVMLLFVYFFFYSGVYFGKMVLDFMQTPRSAFMEILQRGTKDVSLAPQLCVLFLACRLRAMFMKTEPTAWTQTSMMIAASCVCAQACFTVLMPCVSGEYKFGAESLAGVDPSRTGIAAAVEGIRKLVQVTLYVFSMWVVVDIIGMEAPGGAAAPAVAPSVQCTIILTCAYFIMFIAWDGCKIVAAFTASNLDGENGLLTSSMKKVSDIVSVGVETMGMAPMLCVLFIATRLRAMAMGHNGPQPWAQDAMFYTTAAMITTASLAVAGPLVFGGKLRKGLVEGDVTFDMDNWYVGVIFSVVRYLALFGTYVGLIVVIASTFMIEPEAGHRKLAMSTAMQTTLILTDVYFTCFAGVWLSVTFKQFITGDSGSFAKYVDQALLMFDQAKATTGFIPMTVLLFMAARIRAIRVVGSDEAAPQNWAQYMMWAATLGLTLSAVMAFFQPALDYIEGNTTCAMINNILRTLALLSVHAGAVSIVVAIFLITPENSGNLGLADPFKAISTGVQDVAR